MIKRAVLSALVLFSLCLPLVAQQDAGSPLSLYQPGVFNTVDGSALIHSLPMLTFLDGQHFPNSSALGQMGMVQLDLFPMAFLTPVESPKTNASPTYPTITPGEVGYMQPSRNYYAGGEMGVLYGRSSGKFGGDDFESYIVGTVGNDKFNITAGAAYQQSNTRIPRFGH